MCPIGKAGGCQAPRLSARALAQAGTAKYNSKTEGAETHTKGNSRYV